MKRHTKKLSAVLVWLLLVSVTLAPACRRKQVRVTNLPEGVSEQEVQNWFTATGAMRTIAKSMVHAQDFVIQLNRAGVFPDGEPYRRTMVSFKRIAEEGQRVDAFLENYPNRFGGNIQTKLREFADFARAELDQAIVDGSLGIKNENSQESFRAILRSVDIALTIILSLTS